MDSDLDAILNLLPANTHKTVLLLVLLAPYLTRIYYSLSRGHGLRGAWRALWFGTNTPPPPPGLVGNMVFRHLPPSTRPAPPADNPKT